ncbi:MAG: hypothetical protein ACR2FN_01910 [Chitinophagaceae bacterium]
MAKPEQIIKDLELLNSKDRILIEEIKNIEEQIQYVEIQHFLEALKHGTKPETASADLLKKIADDVLDKTGFSEIKIKGGFIDFAIQENKVNPILIELKPGFDRIVDKRKTVIGVESIKLEFPRHKEQVQKYLTSNDFLILTNLNDAFLFNRDALIDYKPFLKIKFTDLLTEFLDSENLWDTVRRMEDQFVKPELENEFFADLVKWFEMLSRVNFNEKNGFTKSELVGLLINKIIFIKTLEDYGLIPYKFLTDEYFAKYEKWEIKGIRKILDNYFTEIEEWFWDYYDTELFRTKIWDYIDKDEANLKKFERIFETVAGVGKWEVTFGKGMVHYNYRKIDEDVFGKAYETFIAKTRKDSGIYYTHRLITQYMSERLIHELFAPLTQKIITAIDKNDYETAKEYLLQMHKITIADTTSGSGSFLIKCFREIYNQYQKIALKIEWVNNLKNGNLFDKPKHVTDAEIFMKFGLLDKANKRTLISSIILKHIYAIDIDDRALETAKTNIWKEAVKLEKGLFNFRKLGPNFNHILPNLQLNFINADTLFDLPVNIQIQIISTEHQEQIQQLHFIRNSYINNPTNPEILNNVALIKQTIRERLFKELTIHLSKHPTFICLEFFYLFFNEEGNILPQHQQGFSGIISNPPWEEIYPVAKEFVNIGKYEMDRANFEKEFEKKLKKDTELKKEWNNYINFYKEYTVFVSENYTHHKLKPETSTAMRSHLNYFKLLFERDMQLLQKDGFLNILIPSSFQTDEGSFGLRKLAFIENKLLELFSFENRGFIENDKTNKTKIFPDVDSRFKFSIVFVQKQEPQPNDNFKSLFYLNDPKDLYTKAPLKYSLEMVKKFSPDNLSIMEFGSEIDYALCSKIMNNHPTFRQAGYVLRREFNVTDDSEYFSREKNTKNIAHIYEGKIIHQFNSNYTQFNVYIDNKIAHDILLDKEAKRIKTDLQLSISTNKVKELFEKHNCKLDYQTYRLIYRSVASSTNERTLIATVIPPGEFCVNSVNYLINCSYAMQNKESFIQHILSPAHALFIMALMNSLILNYFIRNKISANLNMFYLYELPIPIANDSIKNNIIQKAFGLLYNKSDKKLYEDLRISLGIDKKIVDAYKNELTHNQLRADLEILIAKELYRLNKSDWQYLTSTFVYGEDEITRKELDEIISISNNLFD